MGLWGEAWHIIYLADDKCRAEHMERVRRTLTTDHNAGRHMHTAWKVDSPWSAVFFTAAADSDFWNEHVRDPAAAWTAKGGRGVPLAPDEELAKHALPGGVAALHPAGSEHRRRSRSRTPRPPRAQPRDRQAERHARKERASAAKAELRTLRTQRDVRERPRDGKASGRGAKGGGSDSQGSQVCFSFSKAFGACKDAQPGSACPSGRLHKCHVCGDPGHKGKDCRAK